MTNTARRSLRLLLLPLLLAGMLNPFGPHADAAAAKPITIYLDGGKLTSDVAPYIIPKVNVTMVPIRVISSGLGAKVDWSDKTRTATVQQDGVLISMKAGATTATVNGNTVKLDASAETRSGRVMVPLRFVSQNLGLQVLWDGKAQTISLLSDSSGGSDGGNTGGNGSTPGTGGDPNTGGSDGGNGTTPGGSGSNPNTGSGGSGTGTNPGGTDGSNGTGSAQPGTGTGGSNGSGNSGTGTPKNGTRGAWLSSVYNLDWPSAASSGNVAKQKQEYVALLDKLQGMGINAIFLQVRPASDALYPSALVPWSKVLTGKQGQDPGYDPLAFVIDETHKRGMEFHAWFNPFRANTDAKTATLASNHVAVQHPDWIVASGTLLYLNPGIPEARQHIIDTVMEVVKGYDIDGVHLDDYFYPSGGVFSDDATFALYNPTSILLKADWRRNNINTFVRELGAAIHQAKPRVQYGISPFGVWRNRSVDPTGSDSKAGVTAYDSMYADVRTWIRQGWVDYVAPQIYWSFVNKSVAYDKLVDWWSNEVSGTNVRLMIGHAPYKLGTTEAGWQSAKEIINQLIYDEQKPQVTGELFFSAKDLTRNPLGLVQALQNYYRPLLP